MISYEEKYFDSIKQGLEETRYTIGGENTDKTNFFNQLLERTHVAKQKNGRIFFIGNGASAAFSNHMALDWSKNGGVLAKSLSDSALLTALSNDYSYDKAFVEYLKIEKINSDDLVATISSSGNSSNIISVLNYCKENNIPTLGLSGLKENNKSADIADFSLYVPRKTYGLVECIHQIFLHLWLDKYMNIEDWARDSYQNMDASNFKL
ncbi:SIS domain-containing protein [Aquimarina aquimarini]|uniref:SIS domain-containing protein n=1 Tax=Aquimarina aquimarini TaxID=1191734 RepID=UPI000D55E956|nr:SIS domain-containing protein [Aquimarina aquimarini]